MSLRLEQRRYPLLFHSRTASSRGITRYRLRYDARFRPVVFGIHVDERESVDHPTPVWADDAWVEESLRLRAATMVIPGVAAGHLTAARLFGLPLPRKFSAGPLHLVTADLGKKVKREGVILHRHGDPDSAMWCDLPMCSPVVVFLDLAESLAVDELVAVGDAIVGNWHGPPLCSKDYLCSTIAKRRYLRHRPTVERALSLVRESVDSPRETDLRLWALARGLPEPTVHPQVFSSLLGRIIEPDLGYRRAKLALEYEGDHHRSSQEQWTRDIDRDEGLRAEGWVVLKVTARTNRGELERKIRNHLAQHDD